MTLNELVGYNKTLLADITTQDNTINKPALLDYVLPLLNSSRLTDSEIYTSSHYSILKDNIEVDGYLINESGERLQLLIAELCLSENDDELLISKAETYKQIFTRVKNFSKKAVTKYLGKTQANDPASLLISLMSDSNFLDQIDVIEIFLITNTISLESRGNTQSLKSFNFSDDTINANIQINGKSIKKVIVIKYQLIDLNKIYTYEISEGNGEPVIINFEQPLHAIKAAKEDNYESYLSVIPASTLIEIYKQYSSRLLERNVRSFLSFKGVNKGIRDTIKGEPEKFIAFNNGLTITATDIDMEKSGGLFIIKQLTDFQIVNGGQTTASIYFSSKEGIDISKVNVTAKINIIKSVDAEAMDDLISKISQFSNSQNKVSSVDLNSRSPYLVRIKQLSESIITPDSHKWFFERARGEFNTQARVSQKTPAQIEKTYPKNKRLTKEQLAKYYVAWGVTPWLVSKGGEKVFRDFMVFIKLNKEGKEIDSTKLSRVFFEDLIAKAILFKDLEKNYGSGPNAIGQIRASAVPYSLALLFHYTSEKKKNLFNLDKIWLSQSVPPQLKIFINELLNLTHKIIIKYSKSNDYGEYAKKEELWSDILNSIEVLQFFNEKRNITLLKEFSFDKISYENRYKSEDVIDFTILLENSRIHQRGSTFYKQISKDFWGYLSDYETAKLTSIEQLIFKKEDLNEDIISFEKKIIKKIYSINPDWKTAKELGNVDLEAAANFIIKIYTKNRARVIGAFEAEALKAKQKQFHKYDILNKIGEKVNSNKPISIKEIFYINDYLVSHG